MAQRAPKDNLAVPRLRAKVGDDYCLQVYGLLFIDNSNNVYKIYIHTITYSKNIKNRNIE